MEEIAVVKLISQYLHERGFLQTLESLQGESGRLFSADVADLKTGKLQAILDEFALREKHQQLALSSVEHCFSPGNCENANKLLCSFDGLFDGVNLLVVCLMENGVLLFGGAKSQLGVAALPLPLSEEAPPIRPIPEVHTLGSAGILCIDVHPKKRNQLLCGSMDRCAYILALDVEENQADIFQKFNHHTKYVVRAQWAPSGQFFVTGSYDHSLCIYRLEDESERFELVEKLEVNGAVEGLAFTKNSDEFVVGVRNSHLLHCYKLVLGSPVVPSRKINLNEFGDDYVSFVPMHISFSPNGNYFLVSTDRERLILYSWATGKQIANFYGASNDELSQPRHCWDGSGKYIYGTSQDYSICVWEIRSQRLVSRLKGHTSTVRNLHFCEELKVLVSCGFDGAIKLWKKTDDSQTQSDYSFSSS